MSRCRLIPLLALLLISCRQEPLYPEAPADAQLCIYVRVPRPFQTKAGEYVFPEREEESAVHRLQIWVFRHDDGSLLGYLEPDEAVHRQSAYEDRYFLKLSPQIALDRPAVDVYAIANADSILGADGPDAETTRDALDALDFGNPFFGVTADGAPVQRGVPSSGLPFSAVGKNLPMKGEYPSMTVETVTLERMVGKFRFVLCQLGDDNGSQVTFNLYNMKLGGDLIADREFVFNDSGQAFKLSGYDHPRIVFPVPDKESIACSPTPQQYAWDAGLSGQAYEDLVLGAIAQGKLTDVGPYYFRESGKPLAGTLHCQINGTDKEMSFGMLSGSFSRNHSWIVYVYFMQDAIRFTVALVPWVEEAGYYEIIG